MGGSAGIWARQHIDELPRDGRASLAARIVLYTAALSCRDETGWLKYSMARLQDECGLSERITQESVRLLSRLEFLVKGEGGFRLSRYITDCLGGIKCRLPEENVPTGVPTGGIKCRALRGRDSLDSLDSRFSLSSASSKPSRDDDEQRSGPTPGSRPEPSMVFNLELLQPVRETEIERLSERVRLRFGVGRDHARAAVLLGILRNRGKGIHSPEYFRRFIDEAGKLPAGYLDYLERKLVEMRERVAARSP